jgi:hypothetical protein
MTFLWEIIGKSKRDRIRNGLISEELRIENTQKQIEKNRLRWFGHAKRMDEHRIPKTVLEMKMRGKRPRNRPRTWWLYQVRRDIGRRGRSWGR